MLNRLINKNVEIIVALGGRAPEGSTPKKYRGTLVSIDSEFVELQIKSQTLLISKKYIITVQEY